MTAALHTLNIIVTRILAYMIHFYIIGKQFDFLKCDVAQVLKQTQWYK